MYHNSLAINSLNYARILLLTFAEIDHRLNQTHSGLMKAESDVLVIYKYIDGPSDKSVYPHLLIHLISKAF